MKFDDIIARFDSLYINQVDHETKAAWLNRLEAQLEDQILQYYSIPKSETPEYVGVFPYDEAYIHYLNMKCAERNGDTNRYNNAHAAFISAYNDLADFYNRRYESTKETRYTHVLDLF